MKGLNSQSSNNAAIREGGEIKKKRKEQNEAMEISSCFNHICEMAIILHTFETSRLNLRSLVPSSFVVPLNPQQLEELIQPEIS